MKNAFSKVLALITLLIDYMCDSLKYDDVLINNDRWQFENYKMTKLNSKVKYLISSSRWHVSIVQTFYNIYLNRCNRYFDVLSKNWTWIEITDKEWKKMHFKCVGVDDVAYGREYQINYLK